MMESIQSTERTAEASVHRAVLGEGQARAFVVDATALVQRMQDVHRLSRLSTAALGRLAMGALMMAADQKIEGTRVMLRMEGKGPLGSVTVDAEARGVVRGYVEKGRVELPLNEKGKLDVSQGVGIPGLLTVVKDIRMKEPLRTSIPLVTGEVAEDLATYYVQSEQIPTAMALGVLLEKGRVRSAAGYMVQLFPDSEEWFTRELEETLGGLPPVSTLGKECADPQELLQRVGGCWRVDWLGKNDFSFSCNCSREFASSLIKTSLDEKTPPQEPQELCCRFCNTSYVFSPEECAALMAEKEAHE